MSIAVEFNRCALCGGDLPKREPWQPGGSVFCESCRALAQWEAAIHGASLAMSRFLVWVVVEAWAQETWRLYRPPNPVGETLSGGRHYALWVALERGLLRLDWGPEVAR